MLIAVLSDSHGVKANFMKVKEAIKDVDVVLHLGDGATDINSLVGDFKGEIYQVKGNCDFSNKFPKERVVELNGKKIFMTHGDFYNVKIEYNTIFYKGQEVGADIILFGHSHLALVEHINDKILMNPGSIYCGYGNSGETIGILTIEDNKSPEARIIKL